MATQTVTSSADATAPSTSTTALRPDPSKYLTIDGLIRDHAADDAQIPMIGYPASGVADYEIHSARDVDKYVDAASWWYADHGLPAADPELEKAPVIALLTPSGLDAMVTFLALNRLGYAVLFLSTRLTAPAYARLMELADCTRIVSPTRLKGTIAELQTISPCTSTPQIESRDYRAAVGVAAFHRDCDRVKESKKIAWIIHSSGSTGFPKPIFITNLGCLANFRPGLGFRSFTVSPLFHSHALMEFGRALYAKKPIFFGNYALPVTRQNLIAALKVAQPEIICAVPYVLKLLAESEQGIAELARARVVMYGGSSCPDALGDELVSKGVNLAGNYGATETGFIMNSFRPAEDKEWSYMRLKSPVAEHVLMDEISPGVFECVALDGLPSKDTSNSDDPPNSFRTRDLFVRHPDPEKPNYWKYLSRLDDRLTLVNGEKVLPVPIEGHIRKHQLVKEAVVFGFQRTVPGVVIFRSEHASSLSDADFLDAVWPQVEAANSQAETFSHIPRSLVVVMPSDRSYPATDKGTIIRAQFYEHFAADIRAAYDRFEGASTTNLPALSIPELEAFLLAKFRGELNIPLADVTTDIFSAGVDSLQTTRVWNIIKTSIDLGGNGSKLSQNVVFECGTVAGLARHLYNLRLGIDDEEEDSEAAETASMQALIDKYSTFTPHEAADKPTVSSFTVLLTGATGTLGSFLLANLLKRPGVSRVFALVRADSHSSAHIRAVESLRSRNLLHTLQAAEVAKLIALPADMSLPSLGLSPGDRKNVLSTVTHIIHSAWAVNFNLPLLSFEPQHIRGVYNLIEHVAWRTTHSRPAYFFFCSSISTASRTPKPAVIGEAPIPELHHTLNNGYGRSKLVAERITLAAAAADASSKPAQSRVLRIGQLAGDQASATWNDTEAIALLIRSALPSSAGCVPRLDEQPAWLPVDCAARAIEEIALPSDAAAAIDALYDRRAALVYHILNPRSFSFIDQLIPMLTAHPAMPRDFAVVSTPEWLERLAGSDDDVRRNPSKKLLTFWREKYGSQRQQSDPAEGSKSIVFRMDESVRAAPTLGQVEDPVSSGLMQRIVSNWMRKWEGTDVI